ncbi:Adaptive-response sensory-kinase SasA [Pseudomonas fluorescens]|nr:Adaptive-response sensory-kinase SasA [Pseudomonas fluorescens]
MGISLRHLICLAYLNALGYASLCIAAINLGGYFLVESPRLSQSMLLPDGSLSTLLLGTAVLGYANNRKALLQASAGLLLLIALYSLLHSWLDLEGGRGLSLISGFPRMRNATALMFGLLATGLLCSQWGCRAQILARTFGLAVVGLGIASQLVNTFPELDGWRLAFNHNVSGAANLFALFAGLGLLCISWSSAKNERVFDRVTLTTGLLCTFLSCFGWYLLSQQSYESDVHRSELLLDKLDTLLVRTNTAQLRSIQRMAAHWKVRGSLPSDPLWREETQDYLSEFSGFDTIAMLDEKLQPQWLASRDFFETDELYRLLTQPHLRNWLQALPQSDKPYATAANSQDIQSHGIIAIPLSLPSQPGWVLIASVDLSRALGEIVGSGLDGFYVQVIEGEHVLFDSSVPSKHVPTSPINEKSVKGLADTDWRLASYLDTTKKQPERYFPSLILLFGLTLSSMVMISQRLRAQAVLHSQDLERTNKVLELSLQRQTSLQTFNQRIMQYSMDVLCSIDAEGRFTEINSAGIELLGYAREELIGQRYIDFVLPEDRPLTLLTAEKAIEGKPTNGFHNRYCHKDGSVVHLLWGFGWSTAERSFFCVAHNITNLIRAEAYLKDQRDILEMISTDQPLVEIFNAICHMAESRDPTGLCSVQQVDKAQQLLRLIAAPSLPPTFHQAIDSVPIDPSSACGISVFRQRVVIVDDIAQDPICQDFGASALAHGLRACWSIPLISNQRYALGCLTIYHRQLITPSGEQLQLLANAAQLSSIAIEREQDRQRLQASEQRFRSLFSFTPSAVASLDLNGQVESLNHAAGELFGSDKELLGQQLSDCIFYEDVPKVNQHFVEACSGKAQRFETHYVGLRDEVRDLSLTFLPIRVDGVIVGVYAVAKDISERTKAQKQLQVILQELQRSNNELQEFAFVASHDLQEPLRKIQTFSERLKARTKNLDPQSLDYLERMSSAANRMQTLIRDLLAYSRVSSRGKPFKILDTERVLDGVLRDLEADIENSDAQIHREPLPPIQGDPTQIRQLLQNLLSNAMKFHKDNQSPHIRIYSEQETSGEWTLCVEDQGIGFDEKYLDRIFSPFQRLHGRNAYPGTGIGLAIVKKIVERHRALISASSKPGQGSLFRIRFTMDKQD